MNVGMDAAIDPLTRKAVVAGRAVQAVQRLRDPQRDVPEDLRPRAMQEDRVMQLAAPGGVEQELRRGVQNVTPRAASAAIIRSNTSSDVPSASTFTKRRGSATASARYPSRTRL